ncbi:cupin domain-containing protein [Agrococcus sp. SGAir0287]|uniref:cupin domain-containing protein n=1 Tax=Agrococcus sp. SGAir0287 TaxID=2070347 RepID=UPI0010CD0ED5|nr:cupin domain-containing protein [Agrococcus sp. SGAir0287]QCR20213.1 cupin domain-containing protein [Agrococcus sp. SGAir0287]
MRITHPRDYDGTAGKPGSQFTGDVHPYVTMAQTDGVTINTVDFTPGARTYWHHHEHGQILQVLAGRGLVCANGEVHVLRVGDTVWCPPGERHWHGAAPDSFMVHTAISLGQTVWAEPVGDDEYAQQPIDGEDRADVR